VTDEGLSGAPIELLHKVADAQRRFNAAIADLDDASARRSSDLPGWTVGHVLTHVARNADSHVRRADGAVIGEVVEQYPGGYPAREAEIERGAHRAACALVADVRESAERLQRRWQDLPDPAWSADTRDVGGRERALRELPARRWQELEVHVVDLGIGVTHRDWPDAFVAAWLPRLRASLATRLPPGQRSPEAGDLDERTELAWLYGRIRRVDLPTLPPWT